MGLPVTFTMTPGSSHWRQSFWVFTHTAWYLVSHIHAAPFNLQKNLKERVPRTVFMLFGIILNSDNDWKSYPGRLLHSLLMMPWGPQKSLHMTFSKILGLRLPALKIARIDGRMPRPKYSCPPMWKITIPSGLLLLLKGPPSTTNSERLAHQGSGRHFRYEGGAYLAYRPVLCLLHPPGPGRRQLNFTVCRKNGSR